MTQHHEQDFGPTRRALRAMAIVRWTLLVAVALAAFGTWGLFVFRSGNSTTEAAAKYYCPMHPQIRSPVPGTCPICFMALAPIPAERASDPHEHDAGDGPPPLPGDAPPGLAKVMLTLARRQAAGVTTALVTRRPIARELRLAATIEAPEKAISEVRVRSAGFVERVAGVETGQRVKAGQPLVWLYSPDIVRAEEELLATERVRSVSREDGGAFDDLGARAGEAARERLRLLGVRNSEIDAIVRSGRTRKTVSVAAPLAGVVTARQVAVGTYATPEIMLLRIVDLSRVWVSATVPPEDLAAIGVGVKGTFSSPGNATTHEVEASLIEPTLSVDTRTGRVRFIARNESASLRPGDVGEVTVKLDARDQWLVPRDAVVDAGTIRYVFVEQSEGVFTPRVVETGPLIGEERVVLRGLAVGEHVVARGAFLLDSESRLEAAFAPGARDAGAP